MLGEYGIATWVYVELRDVIVPRSECQFTHLGKKQDFRKPCNPTVKLKEDRKGYVATISSCKLLRHFHQIYPFFSKVK